MCSFQHGAECRDGNGRIGSVNLFSSPDPLPPLVSSHSQVCFRLKNRWIFSGAPVSVHDAQPVCSEWDLRNEVSFALIRQSEPIGSDGPEDVWLYNRSVLFSIGDDQKSCAPNTRE